jgi:hypothetical protein
MFSRLLTVVCAMATLPALAAAQTRLPYVAQAWLPPGIPAELVAVGAIFFTGFALCRKPKSDS